jgi:hypothetical protein
MNNMKIQLNEIKRMQQLAGVINENEGIEDDIEQDLMNGEFESEEAQMEYLRGIIAFCQQKINELGQDGPEPTQQDIDDETAADQFDPER